MMGLEQNIGEGQGEKENLRQTIPLFFVCCGKDKNFIHTNTVPHFLHQTSLLDNHEKWSVQSYQKLQRDQSNKSNFLA